MSGFFKGISGISLFLSIRFLIDYLGKESYGVWVLIFTLFQLILLLDFGLQSSLKTKIPVLINTKNYDLIIKYIKTTYKVTIYISIVIFLFFIFIINIVNLKILLNINNQSLVFVKNIFLLNIFFFCLTFIANIHKSLYVAFYKGKYAEESIALNQVGVLILTIILIYFFPNLNPQNKLITISVIYGLFTFIINLIYTFRFFKMEKINVTISDKMDFVLFKDFIILGFKFMYIQVFTLFIFSFDSYIISNSFSTSEVATYDIVSKYFQFPFMIFFAAISPLWSVFAKDYLNNNKRALLYSFAKFNKIFIVLIVLILIFVLLFPFILNIWIKENILIPDFLLILLGLLTILRIHSTYFSFLLFGIGDLKQYNRILFISAIIKLPLSYFFIYLGFGINSVVLSSILILITWSALIPRKCYQLVNKIN